MLTEHLFIYLSRRGRSLRPWAYLRNDKCVDQVSFHRRMHISEWAKNAPMATAMVSCWRTGESRLPIGLGRGHLHEKRGIIGGGRDSARLFRPSKRERRRSSACHHMCGRPIEFRTGGRGPLLTLAGYQGRLRNAFEATERRRVLPSSRPPVMARHTRLATPLSPFSKSCCSFRSLQPSLVKKA